jgi:hypothetical protein
VGKFLSGITELLRALALLIVLDKTTPNRILQKTISLAGRMPTPQEFLERSNVGVIFAFKYTKALYGN